MSLPKEPRQKMINMMYLVLTALLALNVSSEILNAFKTVNNSIIHANDVADDKNATTFASFQKKMEKDETKEKAKFWWSKAEQAKNFSESISAYLEQLKVELKKESGGENIGTADEKFKEDNLDASTRMMVEGSKGKELEQKLTEYRKNILAVLNPEEFKDNPKMYDQIKAKKDEFEKTLPLDLSIPPTPKGSLASTDWASAYFRMTPTIAAVTILSKFQNDVKNSEAQVVDYFHKMIGEVEVVFDQFQSFAGQSSEYLMPGQELTITAGVGAFSKAAKPTIVINGANISLNENGAAVYKTTVNGTGEREIIVDVTYTKPDGTQGHDRRPVKYTVGIPSGSSIFLEKMNVMYVGVENPVTISAGSAGREKMKVAFTNGSMTNVGGDRYIVKPSSVGPAKIMVTVDGRSTPFEIRCKNLPDPTAMVGTKKGGSVSAAEFKVQGGILARLLDSEFDAPFQVVGYRVGANGGSFSVYKEAGNDGARWNGGAADIISKAGPGTSVFFDQIRVKGPDGKERTLPTLAFQLK